MTALRGRFGLVRCLPYLAHGHPPCQPAFPEGLYQMLLWDVGWDCAGDMLRVRTLLELDFDFHPAPGHSHIESHTRMQCRVSVHTRIVKRVPLVCQDSRLPSTWR
eukprot:1059621-Amphidinium_carterae.1